jgi:predicted phage-related endonuclease
MRTQKPQAAGSGITEASPASASGNGLAPAGGLAPAVVRSEREQWLEERGHGVGASELAAVLNEDPRRGPMDVYVDKVAGKPSEADWDWLTFGHDVEGATMRGYARKTGRQLIPRAAFEVIRHPDLAILSATPDGFTTGSERFPAPAEGHGALEAKAVGFHKREEWLADPPLCFVIQVQAQMGCARLAWGSLAALMGGISIADPVDLLRDDAFLEAALAEVERFWWHVRNRVPPPFESKPETRRAIRRLWPTDDGSSIALDGEALELVEEWERQKAKKDEVEDGYKHLVNQLTVRMGSAAVGQLPDGSSFVLKGEDVKPQLCGCGREIRKAFTRRVPRRWWPKLLRQAKEA